MTEGDRHRDEVGSLAEETAKLFAAAADWARDHSSSDRPTASGGATGGATGGTAGARLGEWLADEHIATGAPECRWCPVCQAIGVLRSTSPEVKEHLASLVVVARQLLDSVADAASHGATPKPERSSPPDVEHIDLSEDDSWD